MLSAIDSYDAGNLDLGTLCSQLEGLLGASDLHDQSLVTEFWNHFVEIDIEHELRSEAWAPTASSSDEHLRDALLAYRRWVETTLAAEDHQRR